MSDEYREVRQALSDGPTVGPWTVMPANAGEQCVARINRYEAVPPTGIELSHDSIDAAYIAAANPETVSRLLGEVDTLRAKNERLRNLEKQVRALYNDADEWDCDGLGLHAPFAAWYPVFDALEAIDAAVKEGER